MRAARRAAALHAEHHRLHGREAVRTYEGIEPTTTPLTIANRLSPLAPFTTSLRYEHEGIAKHGAKLVNAVATANVPKLTVVVGGSFGAGNYGMCGRAYSPRFMWMWPNARIGIMGGEQAGGVLADVRAAQAKRQGTEYSDADYAALKERMRERFDAEADPVFATARLWDDGIIEPTQTRAQIALGLATAANAPVEPTRFGVFRM